MKKFLIVVLCLLFCIPAIGLGEEYLVSDNSDVIPANALSSKFQTALDALNEGSLLDAVNGFAGLGSENGADQYSRYAYALLLIQREDPAAAIDLLNELGGFLDSDYQLAFAKKLRLHRYAENSKFGYVDAAGAWQIGPQYVWAERGFRAESALIHDRNSADYTDSDLYMVAEVFSGTTQIGETDTEPLEGKYGLLRNDGTLVVPMRYTEILWTVNGVAAVTDGVSCYLYNLISGEPIGGAYEETGAYENGYVTVKQNGLWGYLNPVTGEYLNGGCVWESALPFSEGYAGVSQDGAFGFINQIGDIAIALQYTGVAPFSEGYAGVRVAKRWGFINTRNEQVIKPAYAAVQTFQNGLCAVQKSKSWGLINADGEIVLRIKYSEITDFDPIYHRAWFRLNKLWGLVASDGSVVIKPTWSYRDDFDGNTLCRVAYKNKYGFIDASGKSRILNQYDVASPFRADYAAVQDSEGNISYINKTQHSFTIDTDVPVECRAGFIEARKIWDTETVTTDENGETQTTTVKHIAYSLYDDQGMAVPVAAYGA